MAEIPKYPEIKRFDILPRCFWRLHNNPIKAKLASDFLPNKEKTKLRAGLCFQSMTYSVARIITFWHPGTQYQLDEISPRPNWYSSLLDKQIAAYTRGDNVEAERITEVIENEKKHRYPKLFGGGRD